MQIHRFPELSLLIDATSSHLTSLLQTLQTDGGEARIVLTGGTCLLYTSDAADDTASV